MGTKEVKLPKLVVVIRANGVEVQRVEITDPREFFIRALLADEPELTAEAA